MRQASPALVQLLASATSFVMADLYTLTLIGGLGPYYYSAGQTAVTVSGHYYILGPAFARSKIKTIIGTQLGEFDVSIFPDPSDTLPPNTPGALPLLQAAWQGQLDGALLQLERCFMPAWGATAAGTVVLFGGRVSDIDCSRTQILLKCRSHLELLNIQMPRRLWQSPCTHVFGGPMCLFDRTTLAVTVSAGGGSMQGSIVTGYTPTPSTLYDQGSIVGATGANAGQTSTIKQLVAGTATVLPAFLLPVSPGDTFTLLPGCDRTQSTCQNVFNNLIHFGGFPYIPTPETAV